MKTLLTDYCWDTQYHAIGLAAFVGSSSVDIPNSDAS